MSAPKRIQLRRTKGWRKPEGAVVVARPSKWGNPFTTASAIENGFADTVEEARRECVDALRDWIDHAAYDQKRRDAYLASIPELRGKDLACWCPLDQPCHADVLLELANR